MSYWDGRISTIKRRLTPRVHSIFSRQTYCSALRTRKPGIYRRVKKAIVHSTGRGFTHARNDEPRLFSKRKHVDGPDYYAARFPLSYSRSSVGVRIFVDSSFSPLLFRFYTRRRRRRLLRFRLRRLIVKKHYVTAGPRRCPDQSRLPFDRQYSRTCACFPRSCIYVYNNRYVTHQQQEQDPTNLYIANLPPNFKENDLDTLLAKFGQVVSTRILRDTNMVSKGVGFAR